MRKIRLAALLVLGVARGLTAQGTTEGCGYDRCALQLLPRLSAIDIVQGGDERRVGSLSFFAPQTVRGAFTSSATAQVHADHALGFRRAGAALTDIGGVLAILGIARAAATSDHRRGSVAAGALGGILVGISVPLQFRADAELSRAVHEFNRQFAR